MKAFIRENMQADYTTTERIIAAQLDSGIDTVAAQVRE